MIPWRRDVERLNRLLRSGLTFHVEPIRERDHRTAESGGSPSVREPQQVSGAPRDGASGRRGRAQGVLVMALDDGVRRVAACHIPIAGSDRTRRLSISRGFSECAMALGLGVDVYRGRRQPAG